MKQNPQLKLFCFVGKRIGQIIELARIRFDVEETRFDIWIAMRDDRRRWSDAAINVRSIGGCDVGSHCLCCRFKGEESSWEKNRMRVRSGKEVEREKKTIHSQSLHQRR